MASSTVPSVLSTPQAQEAVRLTELAMFSPEGQKDPYQFLDRVHEYAEVAWMPAGYLAVFSYAACNEVMRSRAFGRTPLDPSVQFVWPHELAPEQLEQIRAEEPKDVGQILQFMDGPDHKRQRALVDRAFSARRLQQLRDYAGRVCHDVIDRIPAGEPVDIVSTFAYPLARAMLAELMGIPEGYRRSFEGQDTDTRAEREPDATFEELLQAVRARRNVAEDTRRLLAMKRADPRDDLVTTLIQAEEGGERLSEPELVALTGMVYRAGHSTTAHMFSIALNALLRHPDQLARLRADRTLLRSAVEEILRYDTVVITVDYNAQEDTVLAGVPVAAKTPLHLFLGAANHDPRAFSEPARFDVGRNEAMPLSFGAGPHICLGAALARLEGQVLLGALLDRFPSWQLADEDPPRVGSFNYRGFSSFHVVFRTEA